MDIEYFKFDRHFKRYMSVPIFLQRRKSFIEYVIVHSDTSCLKTNVIV
jgi:hypothetical protein